MRQLARQYSSGANTEDLVQEGILALLEARRTWREESQFWTYARRFVLGAMVRFATTESEEAKSASDDVPDIESESLPADVQLERAEVLANIADSMIALSEIERRIVRLHLGDDQSLATVAETLKMPKSSVFDIYRGAIAKLRELVVK